MVKSQLMEQTRSEGRIEGIREALLRALARRTKQAVPEEVAERIRACSEESRLDLWLDIVAEVSDLDSFRRQTGL